MLVFETMQTTGRFVTRKNYFEMTISHKLSLKIYNQFHRFREFEKSLLFLPRENNMEYDNRRKGTALIEVVRMFMDTQNGQGYKKLNKKDRQIINEIYYKQKWIDN